MSKIEKELLDAAEFKPKKKYDNRQDYLAALARATIAIDDAVFDKLSDPAADWSNDAVKAIREKKPLPDFPDAEGGEEPAEEVVDASEVVETLGGEEEAPAPKKTRTKGKPPQRLPHPKIDLPEDVGDGYLTDEFGCAVGSKAAAAAAMFKNGARMADVNASIGGTFYNLLTRFEKQGHVIEKGPNGKITLKHKESK